MRKWVAAALAIAPAPMALAQETSPADPLCGGLDLAIAAAWEARPFMSLLPAGQTPGSLPALKQKPLGFEALKACEIYRAGNAVEGVNGGGPYNYFRCSQFQMFSFQDAGGEAKAVDAHTKLAAQTVACLTPKGWTASEAVRTKQFEDFETVVTLTRPGLQNDVLVEFITDNSSPSARSPSTTWSVFLKVRSPNPGYRKAQ
ncbi:MAG: hypothetical protein IPO30_09790 [Hyphomonadaceae bacterium]|nr:hypothetical protein [Hyphomonadaceae bacterium]